MATNPRGVPISGIDSGVHLDAFGRLKISQPQTIFESKLLGDKQPLFWDEAITDGSGNAASTYSAVTSAVTLHVESGDTVIRQTFERLDYQPGKGHTVMMTGVLGAGGTGVVSQIGLFNAGDGLFFQLSGSTLSVVKRNATVDTVVPQSDWNVDTLDGTASGSNPCGLSIDGTKAQLFWIDFQWLGVGTVRYGIFIDGMPVLVHVSNFSNSTTAPYMTTPNLPVRYAISSTSATAEMLQICCCIESDAGHENVESTRSISSGVTQVDANVAGTFYPIIGIRLKSTHLDKVIHLLEMNVMSRTDTDMRYVLCLNPTITGTFTYADITNSALQVARGVTATTIANEAALGTIIQDGYISSDSDAITRAVTSGRHLGSAINGTPDEIVVVAIPFTMNEDVFASLTWSE